MRQIKFDENDSKKFFILGHYQRNKSNNVAVLGNKEKYKKVLDEYIKIYNEHKSIKMIKVNDYKYTFIFGDIEVTLVLIETVEDLYKHRLFYSKYV